MRVLLIDNQTHVRAAIQFLLDQQPGVYVIGTADSSDVLLEQAHMLRPDIVLISWELWRKPAAELHTALSTLDVRPKVIVFSSRPEAEQEALKSGADAFLCVYDPPEMFLNVLQTTGDSARPEDLGSAPDDTRRPAS